MTAGWAAGRLGGWLALLAVTISGSAPPLAGQTLEKRLAAVRDGVVRMSFTAREGVCGNGRNIHTSHRSRHWEPHCEPGPVHVVLVVRDGRLHDVDTYVGGRWRTVEEEIELIDVGRIDAPEAARTLLALAERSTTGVGEDLIFPATLADSVTVWPELVRLARDDGLPRRTRKAAVFWLGQMAGEAVSRDLVILADNPDRDIQESAVFALSQLRDGQGIEPLIRIARTHGDPEIRKRALFWLGQSGDARAIALFEAILLER